MTRDVEDAVPYERITIMLVNLKEILALAEEKKCAVGAFNTPNLE